MNDELKPKFNVGDVAINSLRIEYKVIDTRVLNGYSQEILFRRYDGMGFWVDASLFEKLEKQNAD